MATAPKPKRVPKGTRSPGIDVKAAAAIATKYFHENFPQGAQSDTTLEEIEEDRQDWLITLSYSHNPPGQTSPFFPYGPARAYKRFTINKATGRVISAKIYSVT